MRKACAEHRQSIRVHFHSWWCAAARVVCPVNRTQITMIFLIFLILQIRKICVPFSSVVVLPGGMFNSCRLIMHRFTA